LEFGSGKWGVGSTGRGGALVVRVVDLREGTLELTDLSAVYDRWGKACVGPTCRW